MFWLIGKSVFRFFRGMRQCQELFFDQQLSMSAQERKVGEILLPEKQGHVQTTFGKLHSLTEEGGRVLYMTAVSSFELAKSIYQSKP